MTAFQNPQVRFVNSNVAEFDAYKFSAIAVVTGLAARKSHDEHRAVRLERIS
jgi:TPP-dependent trihydroxycyclohexane-1,2-dione (THcHDO) dehydratase